jgi:hypothetical protein
VNQNFPIYFDFLGLHLQEPMTLLWDGLITIFSFVFYLKTFKRVSPREFPLFFRWMSAATFLGIFGHLFFPYFGIIGKFPSWICVSITSYFFCVGTLKLTSKTEIKRTTTSLIIIKSILLTVLSLLLQNFTWIAIDSVFSYIVIGSIYGFTLWKRNNAYNLLIGSLILIPTIFIFGLKINIHPLFNKDDFSHLFVILSLIFYYFCITKNKIYDV